jgi:glucokinase
MPASEVIVAIDLGASWIRGAIFDLQGNCLFESRLPSRDSISGKADAGFKRSVKLAHTLADWAKDNDFELWGGCIAVPEYVDASGNLTSDEQIEWHRQPVDLLTEALNIPWISESDVRCAALAETTNYSDFLYVTVSSGISHCLVIDGKPFSGHHGRAIGLGTMKARDGSRTVEEIASGLGISRRYFEITNRELNTSEVFSLYEVDPDATKIIDAAAYELAFALNHISMILDPGLIIVGGGFWLNSEAMRTGTIANFEELMKGNLLPRVLSASSSDSTLQGAAIAALRLMR